MTTHYDARRRAVARSVAPSVGPPVTTFFIWDNWSLIEERTASGNLIQSYVHGPVIDEILAKTDAAGTVYFHHDGLGSTAALSNATGTSVETYTYDAYGAPKVWDSSFSPQPSSLIENRFLFTGREWIAEAGIYDYRNRAYSVDLGRFQQVDPIRFEGRDLNLHRYVGNSVVVSTDPEGLACGGALKDCCERIRGGRYITIAEQLGRSMADCIDIHKQGLSIGVPGALTAGGTTFASGAAGGLYKPWAGAAGTVGHVVRPIAGWELGLLFQSWAYCNRCVCVGAQRP